MRLSGVYAPVLGLLALAQLALAAGDACPAPADPGPGAVSVTVNNTDGSAWPFLMFKTEPNANPPNLAITANGETLSDGLLFFAPSGTPQFTKQFGGVMMSDQGQLVWNGPTMPSNSASISINNFRVQTLNGTDYITYWQGVNTNAANTGHGYGQIYFVNSAYDIKYAICPQLGLVATPGTNITCQSDFHEQLVTDRGTLLITAYNTTQADLTSVGGPKNGWIFDAMFFEISIPDGKILFSWSSAAHAPVATSHQPLQGTGSSMSSPWDFFHINAVSYVESLNAYLVNGRHTWTTYLVDAKDGHVIWEIDGLTGGDFGPLPDNGHFRWQHDARVANISSSSISISWFNNYNAAVNNGTNGSMETNGLEMRFALPPNKKNSPTVLEHLTVKGDPIYADSQGRYAFQPGPDSFITQFMAYGQIPVMREYGLATDGSDLRWQARFGRDNFVQSYRGYKQPWSGQPSAPPKLVVQHSTANGCNTSMAYASWNGATNATGWAVYEGQSSSTLKQTGIVPKKSFETSFTPAASSQCVQVAAIVGGTQVKRSNLVCS